MKVNTSTALALTLDSQKYPNLAAVLMIKMVIGI